MQNVCSHPGYLFLYTFRHGIRLRGKKLCDSADSPPADTEEEEDNKGEEERRSKEKEAKNEGEEEEEEGQVDTDDCEVCPGIEAPPLL